jgi:hypothetical protein
MSDNVLKLIPVDPLYVPEASAQLEATRLLALLVPEAEDVIVTVTDQVRFVDQGTNFERVSCPNCGSELDTQWWQSAMSSASKTDYSQLQVSTPCCGSVLSLNELRYVWPAGFARFVLEVRNPDGDISDNYLFLISRILKCEIRKIWAHY